MGRLLVVLLLLAGCSWESQKAASDGAAPITAHHNATVPAGTANHVGAARCAECHRSEFRAWQDSHHDLAMQPAGPETVLGNFDGATFDYADVTSTFRQRAGRYFVHTDGPGGERAEFEIRYTFGVEPLQQYLIEMPGGRLQAFGIAWDSRPQAAGGQRWFHLYPDQDVVAGHPLHWTGRNQNWNFMCAQCHSTGLSKGYDAVSDTYATTWAEINVACEACHGPGQAHVEWAQGADRDADQLRVQDLALAVHFGERAGVRWLPIPGVAYPQRSEPRQTRVEIDACGRCHGRATPLHADFVHGISLLDSYRPALLTPDQYWPDGQMRGEVFTWGSFLQSRMQAAGVTCSDCHEPHSLKLRRPGNALCGQCHVPERYDHPDHTHHAHDSAGSMCTGCHMPVTTFMQVDDRHDHAFRIPRPDLSVEIGVPNACNQCHTGRDAEWAAANVQTWFPAGPDRARDFAQALQAATSGAPGVRADLAQIISNPAQPGIVRASAVHALASWLTPATLPNVTDALKDPDPLVRMAAVGSMAHLPDGLQARHLTALLADPVRAVRIEAATALAGAGEAYLDPGQRKAFSAALEETVAALQLNADRADANVNLGNLQLRRGNLEAATAAYRQAIRLDPAFAGAYVNLADLERARGRGSAAIEILREGLERLPGSAALQHALGLAHVRAGQRQEARKYLQGAAEAAPETAHYSYVLAVALHDWGRPDEARERLQESLQHHPFDRDLLTTLALYQLEAGDRAAARRLVARLQELDPDSAIVRQLTQSTGAPTPTNLD